MDLYSLTLQSSSDISARPMASIPSDTYRFDICHSHSIVAGGLLEMS